MLPSVHDPPSANPQPTRRAHCVTACESSPWGSKQPSRVPHDGALPPQTVRLSRSRHNLRICLMKAVNGPTVRESYRAHLRQRTLDAAGSTAASVGWAKLRVGQVAADIGVSRAMIYKEFGDKQGLGEALVVHEGERFLVGIDQVLAGHLDDTPGGIRAAVAYTLAEAERSPLLRAVLVSHGDSSPSQAESAPTGVLPLLTTSKRLLDLASGTLTAWLEVQMPQADRSDLRDASDATVRLTVSHLALPDDNAELTGRRICEVAFRFLDLQGK